MQTAILNNPPMKNHIFRVCRSSQIGKRDGILSLERAHARKARSKEGLEAAPDRLPQLGHTILKWFWGAHDKQHEMKKEGKLVLNDKLCKQRF